MTRTTVIAVLGLLISTSVRAQDKADPAVVAALQKIESRVFKADAPEVNLRWDSLKQLREDVNKRDVEAWRAIKTKADWEKFRDERIAKLRASLGKFPEAPNKVKVVVTKTLAGDNFIVENLIYESRPGLYVTANL